MLVISNPAFPKDKSKAAELSADQLAVVHEYLIECLNSRKKINEAKIILMLVEAGLPLVFNDALKNLPKEE